MSCSPPPSLIQDSLGTNSVTLVTVVLVGFEERCSLPWRYPGCCFRGCFDHKLGFSSIEWRNCNDLLGFTPLTEEQQHCSYEVLNAEVAGIIEGKLDGFMTPAIKVDCAEDPSRPSDGAFAGLSLLESKLAEDMAGEALTVVVSVSVTNIVDTAAIAVESLVTVLVKDVVKMPPTELQYMAD